MPRNRKGFTLLELLIVLGIVMILAAISLPHFLNARIRSQVVVAHSHTRTLAQGLDLYAVDHRHFPSANPQLPGDPFGIFSHHQLSVLTSPIHYVSEEALQDPFGVIQAQVYDPDLAASNDFPRLDQPNSFRSLLYFHYPSLSSRNESPALFLDGASAISIGPDRKDSLGVYRPFDPVFFANRLPSAIARHPHDTVYQPTNGVRSGGDIGSYAGEAKRFRVP